MVKEIFKPSLLNLGFSVGFFLVMFLIYPAMSFVLGITADWETSM